MGNNNSYVHYNRGLDYNDMGDFKNAIESYNEAIKLNPSYAVAFKNRGIAYYGLGEYKNALNSFSKATGLDPNLNKWPIDKKQLFEVAKKELMSDLKELELSWEILTSNIPTLDPKDVEFGKLIGLGNSSVVEATLANNKVPSKDKQLVAIKQIELKEEEAIRIRKEIYMLWYLPKVEENYFVKLIGWFKQKEKTLSGPKEYVYLIMEKADSSLEEFIKKRRDDTMNTYLLVNIVKAIQVLHSLDVAHCDIKPANILVFSASNQWPQVKLCDFGRSQKIDNYSLTLVAGTQCYLAPELVKAGNQGQKITASSEALFKVDIWSLGKLIYFIWVHDHLPTLEEKYHWYTMNASVNELIKSCLYDDPTLRIDIDGLLYQVSNLDKINATV